MCNQTATRRVLLVSSRVSSAAILLCLGSIYAAVPPRAAAKIIEVTLHPQGAQVVHNLPIEPGSGAFSVELTDLSATIPAESVSVRTSGNLSLRDVQLRIDSDARERQAERAQHLTQLQQIEQQRQELGARREALRDKLQQLQAMQNYASESAKLDLRRGVLQGEAFKTVLQTSFSQRDRLADEALALRVQEQALDARSTGVDRSIQLLNERAPSRRASIVVTGVRRDVAAGRIQVAYDVADVGWSPVYTLDVAPLSSIATLSLFANIDQHSGETWNDVKLRFTSAPWRRPRSSATGAVGQSVLRVAEFAPLALEPFKDTAELYSLFNARADSATSLPDNVREALIQLIELTPPKPLDGAAPAMLEGIGGRAPVWIERSVETLSSQARSQRLALASFQLPLRQHWVAIPVRGPEVHRIGVLTNDLPKSIAAGPVEVYLDGRFQGRDLISDTEAGGTFEVGLGVDPRLRGRRRLISRGEGVEVGRRRITLQYRLEVEADTRLIDSQASLGHSALPIRLVDRVPVSAPRSRIRVELQPSDSPLSMDPAYLRSQRPAGLLRWDLMLSNSTPQEDERASVVSVEYAYTVDFDRSFGIGFSGFASELAERRTKQDPDQQ